MYNTYDVSRANVGLILKLLSAEYGRRDWQPQQSAISVLVQTILSQNTSDRNSGRAFQRLLASFNHWNGIADADVKEIAQVIQGGGLGKVKARYIKQALIEIRHRCGRFELNFLKRMSVDDARDWLRQLPGVGMKTASCILLFAFGMPALPVDTHIFRVAKRLGLIDPKVSVAQAHKLLEQTVLPDDVYQFHILLIEHGRKTCKAHRPHCLKCVLRGICPSGEA